jgi:Zn-dependent peptidase ImmA (M78 family)
MFSNDPPKADETRARRLADKIIREYAITRPEEIRLEDISMDRNVLVREGALSGSEAYLIRKGNKGIIRVRKDIPEAGRKRFAIAHELGHWEMHSEENQLKFCSEDDIGGYLGSPMEIEANAFASELLMPTRLVSKEFRSATPSLDLIKALSSAYNVSLTAAAVKFIQISKEDCMAIFSRDGIVRWWRKGKEYSSIPGIEKYHPLHLESEACEIFRGRKESTKMVRVPNEAWFPWMRERQGFEVYEQSIRLGNYPTILTLLWMISES